MDDAQRNSEPRDAGGDCRHDAFRYWARLRRVRERLLQDIGQPLSAEDAARVADLSPNYFSTYFRQRVGQSYTRWAHGVRVACAIEMLRTSDLGITEVAYRVGFRDLRTFERAFKRIVGSTPRSFRHRIRRRVLGAADRHPSTSTPDARECSES